MDIHQFLELFVGRWRSQRSDHQFSQENGSDIRSVIDIIALSGDHLEVLAICQKYNVEAIASTQPMQLSWEEESLSSNKPKGKSLFVAVPDPLNANKGLILTDYAKGNYEFAEDESLSIQTITDQGLIEERVWYGNPNLRFRVATLVQTNFTSDRVVSSSKFYSEIRVAPPKP
ncbi:MAG: hypothetical protein AUK48_04650 [Oscillatoriales cyanobacterium CG2_30_44_21]|nr:MAG: hypothetical protein AUK48_04650 [Oscillatoriales cyanobacterium CG2_30_44_21]